MYQAKRECLFPIPDHVPIQVIFDLDDGFVTTQCIYIYVINIQSTSHDCMLVNLLHGVDKAALFLRHVRGCVGSDKSTSFISISAPFKNQQDATIMQSGPWRTLQWGFEPPTYLSESKTCDDYDSTTYDLTLHTWKII